MTAPASPSKLSWLMSFTGLIPLALTLPLLFLHLWTLGILVSFVSAILIISYHLQRRQGVTSLDMLSLGFVVVNAVLYFGFHTTILFEYLDTIIYTLLFGQVLLAQVRGESWTVQYAKRSVAPELWTTRPFLAANRFISLGWGTCFLLCALVSLWHTLGAWQVLIPIVVLVSMAILTPRLAQWYGRRIAGSPPM
jgi:hypothetical protein